MSIRAVGEATFIDDGYNRRLFFPLDFLIKALGMSVRSILEEEDKKKYGHFLKKIYCYFIRTLLIFNILRIMISTTSSSQFWSANYAGDMSGFYPRRRGYYLLSVYSFGTHSMLIIIHFHNTQKYAAGWLRKFLQLFAETSPRLGLYAPEYNMGQHQRRKMLSLLIAFLFVFINVIAVLIVNVAIYKDHPEIQLKLFVPWVIYGCTWAFFSTSILVVSVCYFVVICMILQRRFEEVSSDLENIYISMPSPSKTVGNQKSAVMMQSLSLAKDKHFKTCDMLQEANRFWSKYLFYTYTIHLPFSCYCIYELLINSFDVSTTFALIWYSMQSVLMLCTISLLAAKVSKEAHRPYTLLYCMSLNSLSTDLRLKLGTFLQHLGGTRIGLMCLDLFVITNGKVSSVCASILSSFFIIVDFNKGDGETKKIFCTL